MSRRSQIAKNSQKARPDGEVSENTTPADSGVPQIASATVQKSKKKGKVPQSDTLGNSGRTGARGGGLLRSGNPGNKGGGNTSNEYRLRMRTLLYSEAHRAALEQALADPTSSAFVGAMTHAAKYAYGLPAQKVEVEGGTVNLHVTPADILAKVEAMRPNLDALAIELPALPPGESTDG